jgi:AraC family transcriptional regulator
MPPVYRDGTLGTKARQLALSALSLTEARFTPSQVLPWHAHERASFCIVLDGTYTEEFRGSQYRLSALDLLFKPDGLEHRDRYDASGAQCLIIDLESSWMRGLRERGPLLAEPWFFSAGAFPDAARRVYGEFIEPDDLSGLVVETLCAELMIQATRHSRVSPASPVPLWLQRVREMLHANSHHHLTLDQLARVADVHPVHLAQTFRVVYSCTVGEYVRNLRVQRAADELRRTRRPLAEIAIACGFYDQSHFNRLFKKYMNVTPAQFRKRQTGAVA